MFKHLYNEKKAAQAAAFFLLSAQEAMPIVKLMKLLYLAERRSYEKYGQPMVGDRLVSMPHGPVLSQTLNHLNGMLPSCDGGWDSWMSDRAGHLVALAQQVPPVSMNGLLELSDADAEILTEIWDSFGHMTEWELRDYTHDHCPEWKDPDGSMIPIKFEDLFRALNLTNDQSREYLSRLKDQNNINAVFAAVHH